MKKLIATVLFIFLIITCWGQSPVTSPTVTRILFVFDASYSMTGYWGNNQKMTVARNTLISLVDSLERIENVQMALRVYGHQSPVPPQDCNDTKLEVPFSSKNASAIRQKLRYINPRGTTPLANSLERAGGDFPNNCDNCRNVIVLITDGLEECNGDPCAVSAALQKKGIVLKPFIIGIGIDEKMIEGFNCIGQFVNTTNETQLSEALKIVITHILNTTSVQVNLLDSYGKPTETDVDLTFYDALSGRLRYNYIHTINYKGLPDTLTLDPLLTYNMRVNTIPPVDVKNIKLNEGKHTVISADCPQGVLVVKANDINQFRGIKFSVRQKNNLELLNAQELNIEEKYLIGFYDIDIPTLPIIRLKNVEVKQSHTTSIEIPRPGIANILLSSVGIGSLYKVKENGEQEWVYNLKTNVKSESLTLLPGFYIIIFRPLNAKQSMYSSTRRFEVKSGSTITVNFQ